MHKWQLLETFRAVLVYTSIFCLQCTNGQPDVLKNIDSALAHPFIDFPQMHSFRKTYDFIIVGCGAAGSLLTNRLTEDPSHQVLCIEAGDKENGLTDMPYFLYNLPLGPYDWKYKTEYQEGICEGMTDQRCPWPRGKALGGSTVLNYMMYTRGNRYDFNGWAKMGNTGWSFKEIVHYFRKFENARNLELKNATYYGMGGELNLEYHRFHTDLLPPLIESTVKLGVPHRDINGPNQIGVTRVPFMLRNNRRLTAAHAFLFPIRDRSNLHVAKNTFVKKILIDPKSKTAIGVEVSVFNVTHIIRATKEVILSAGTINSPQLLMLSGIGPRKHLRKLGIPVIQDLPVGKRLQDHPVMPGVIFLSEKPSAPYYPFPLTNYVLFSRGDLTVPGTNAYAFINTRNKSADNSGLPDSVPDTEIVFVLKLRGGALSVYSRAQSFNQSTFNDWLFPILGKNAFNLIPVVLKPKSVGYLELRSANPFDHPKIFSNYFKEEADQQTLLRGIRMAIKIGLGEPLRSFKPKLHEFKLRQCEEHSFNTDGFWLCAIRVLGDTLYHPVGTCKMGPTHDKGAVVDPQLRVKGIKKLRVVDASVMPQIPTGHTTSTCYVIAEKAADIIKEEYSES